MLNKREVDILRPSEIEEAYKAAREDFKGGLLRFMHMQFLEEIPLSDAARLTSEMLYLRFSVNLALFKDLQRESVQDRIFFDMTKKEVYVSLGKLLAKSKACSPVFMRLMSAGYDKCSTLKDVSAYPRNTDNRYSATLLGMSTDFLSVAYCVLPKGEIEKLYSAGVYKLLKVHDDVGVIPDYSLCHSALQDYAVNQAEEYLRIKATLSGPTYHAWKNHRPSCVASEYVVCGLRTDVEKLLQKRKVDTL